MPDVRVVFNKLHMHAPKGIAGGGGDMSALHVERLKKMRGWVPKETSRRLGDKLGGGVLDGLRGKSARRLLHGVVPAGRPHMYVA